MTGVQTCALPILVQYNITSLQNMWWRDSPYSVFSMKKEDCIKSCLEDCYCGAVLYMGDDCSKYKLPFRYGSIDSTNSIAAFFKGNRSTQVQEVSIGSMLEILEDCIVFLNQ